MPPTPRLAAVAVALMLAAGCATTRQPDALERASRAAPTIGIAWDAPQATDPRVDGYRLEVGTATKAYTQSIDLGSTTSYRLPAAPDVRYFFRLFAYANQPEGRAESDPSPELNAVVGGVSTCPNVTASGNSASAPIRITVISYGTSVSRAAMSGVPLAFNVDSPARIVRIAVTLGSERFEQSMSDGDDGHTLRGMPVAFPGLPLGKYPLNVEATDDRGCIGRTSTLRMVTLK